MSHDVVHRGEQLAVSTYPQVAATEPDDRPVSPTGDDGHPGGSAAEAGPDPIGHGVSMQGVRAPGALGPGMAVSDAAAPPAPAEGAGDPTLRAVEALCGALDQLAKDHALLEQRLRRLRRQRAEGRTWHEILADEEPPGTMQLVSRMLAVLAQASGTLRKELVEALRREGVSIPAIARLFGVTHQRVSNLLRRPSE